MVLCVIGRDHSKSGQCKKMKKMNGIMLETIVFLAKVNTKEMANYISKFSLVNLISKKKSLLFNYSS